MTSILSLPSTPGSLSISNGDDACSRTCASEANASLASTGTVQRRRATRVSAGSLSSNDSCIARQTWAHSRSPLPRLRSCLDLSVSQGEPSASRYRGDQPIRSSDKAKAQDVFHRETSTNSTDCPDRRQLIISNVGSDRFEQHDKLDEETLRNEEVHDCSEQPPGIPHKADQDLVSTPTDEPQAFRRWISKLRRRYHRRPRTAAPDQDQWNPNDVNCLAKSPSRSRRRGHQKSDSQASSLGFVWAVKSATETVASASIATVSRRATKRRRGTQQSSIVSTADPRASIDSRLSVIDEAARLRSRKRREKLEELIRTEEGYVADVKALSNAYLTILGHHSTQASFARPAAQRLLAEILHLHDELLGHLLRVVPFAEYDQKTAKATDSFPRPAHVRWHSVDIVPPRTTPAQTVLATIRRSRRSLSISRSSDDEPCVLQCSPKTVAAVAAAFVEQMPKFKVYEDYGVNYDLFLRDIEETQQATATWQQYDRGIEALAAHVNPMRSQAANRKKAMTIKDLLIKPIQRLPRYELLFSDLRMLTPVCDDPAAHETLNELLTLVNQTCRRMNEAKENPNRARLLETSLLIEDRLSFSSQISRSVFCRLLGHVQLCGCLYIAYRSRDGIKGRYVICILFQSTLLLANADEDPQKYTTLAGIGLANATIEETDNARGLQCHTAPHAWKIVFEHSARMYELIFAACSSMEGDIWRKHISDSIHSQAQAVADGAASVFELQSPLTAEMRNIGKAFGKPGSFVRRMSVHRTATIGPTTDVNQVIIQNTQAVRDVQDNSSQKSLQIARSQSLATPSHVLTLTPRRAERQRLEALLVDVWTRELLPYPGMARRTDPIRVSANNVMRKFSMASIASNFSSSKRSTSHTSMSSWRREDIQSSKSKRIGGVNPSHRGCSSSSRPPLVDFHNAPEAFLPADFEIQNPTGKHKRSAFRALTMTMERPFSPIFGNENHATGVRRAKSVHDGMKHMFTPAASSSCPDMKLVDRHAPLKDDAVCDQSLDCPPSRVTTVTVAKAKDKSPKRFKSKLRLFRLFDMDHR